MLEFTLNRLNEIIEKLGKRITKLVYKNKTLKKRAESAEGDWQVCEQIVDQLKAELEKSRWVPVSESLPGKKYWGEKIWIIIDKQPSCQSYYGKRIGMTHWMPTNLP